MTIEIDQPEIEALIRQRLQSGAFRNIEEVLLHALKSSDPEMPAREGGLNAKNLVELFADSPFAGMNMDFERDKDTGRAIEL